ncbi:3-phosphoinositide dependent protein kinase-1 [Branchiostoma belcheri]|nr:3-phosphoinositide dependent protein kinase-1 [Branchiostoma belcheri]
MAAQGDRVKDFGNVRYRRRERSVASRLPKPDRKLSDYNRKGYRAFPTAVADIPDYIQDGASLEARDSKKPGQKRSIEQPTGNVQFCQWIFPRLLLRDIPSNPDPISSSTSSHQSAVPPSAQPEELQGATAAQSPGNMAVPTPAAAGASPATPTPPQPRKKTPADFKFGRIWEKGPTPQ